MTEPTELNLTEVVEVAPEEVTEEQKTFLEEHKAELTPEQATKFGIEQEKKEEEIKPEEYEPETRTPAEIKKEEEKKGDEDESEVDPEDQKTIGKVVDERMKPVTEALKQIQKVKDEQEVDAFLRVRPEFNKYREVMIKFVSHPAYAQIPVHNIAAIVASKDLQRLGAEKERETAKKVAETKEKGGQVRKPGTGEVDWKTASKEEFEAQKAKVLGQG